MMEKAPAATRVTILTTRGHVLEKLFASTALSLLAGEDFRSPDLRVTPFQIGELSSPSSFLLKFHKPTKS